MVTPLNWGVSVTVRGYEDMAGKYKAHTDEAQIAAVESWILDVERTYQCGVRVVTHAGGSKGRLTVRIEACDIAGDRLVGVRVRRKTTYPCGHSTSYLGMLLKELIALHADLERYQAAPLGVAGSSGPSADNTP